MLSRSPATPVHRPHESPSVIRPASARRSAWRPSPALTRLATPWLAWALLGLGTCGFAAAWITLAVFNGAQNSWMAVVAGVDAALLLRFSRMPAGPSRMLLAVAGSGATIALSSWGIAATQVGRSVGVLPWISALKLGPDYAWTLLGRANTPVDLAWLVAGIVVAAVLGR